MISSVDAPRTLTLERNPQFQTVKDAGADEVADASGQDHPHREQEQQRQVTDIEQNKVDFGMIDPPASDRLQEVKAQYGDRFRLEESINTYYFWMNTQKPRSTTQGPPGDQLRRRPEALNRIFGGRLHRLSRSCRRACPATRSTSCIRSRPGQGETAHRRGKSGGPRHHRLDQ